MTASFKHKKVQQHPRLGIEVLSGCDLRNITLQQIKDLKQSLWKHGVVVVKKQNLTAAQLVEFAKKSFGDFVAGEKIWEYDSTINSDLQSPGVFGLGNLTGSIPTEEIGERGSWEWHQDKDLLPRTPELEMNELYVVMLYGIEIPAGIDGQQHTTEFLDLVDAYNNLDPSRRTQLEKMLMHHKDPFSLEKENKKPSQKIHPVVSTHKVTGKKGLYLASQSAIPVGMEERPEEAEQFWLELLGAVLESTPVYSHVWEKGDIVFWDNSQVMHRGIPYDSMNSKRIALRLGVVAQAD